MGVYFSSPSKEDKNNLFDMQVNNKIDCIMNKLESISEENLILKKEIEVLKKENDELKNNSFNDFSTKNKEDLKKFVDIWYEKNSDNIDIGVIDLPFGGSIDILPDSIEKHLYVKTLSILMEIISQSKINFMGQEMIFAFKNSRP
tara:strand:- start:812 stop:1246 length:435 start_codon:yes stop_codon:yes gene_type:complete